MNSGQASSPAPPVELADSNKWEDCKLICPQPDVVFDCGANIGQAAKNLRQAYPAATIYCFEPVKGPFAELESRADSLKVHPVRLAVADYNGRADINLTVSTESHSLLGFLEQDNPLADYHRVVGQEAIRVCRLDDWCDDNDIDTQRVDVIKMDVQGAELDALRGAVRILRTAKLVLLEVAFVPYYRDCPLIGDIDAFMDARGFARRALYPSVRPDLWADAMYIPDRRTP